MPSFPLLTRRAGLGSGGAISSGGRQLNNGAIAGIVVAVLVVLAVFSFTICFTMVRKKNSPKKTPAQEEAQDRRDRMYLENNGPLVWNAQRFPEGDPRRQGQRNEGEMGLGMQLELGEDFGRGRGVPVDRGRARGAADWDGDTVVGKG